MSNKRHRPERSAANSGKSAADMDKSAANRSKKSYSMPISFTRSIYIQKSHRFSQA